MLSPLDPKPTAFELPLGPSGCPLGSPRGNWEAGGSRFPTSAFKKAKAHRLLYLTRFCRPICRSAGCGRPGPGLCPLQRPLQGSLEAPGREVAGQLTEGSGAPGPSGAPLTAPPFPSEQAVSTGGRSGVSSPGASETLILFIVVFRLLSFMHLVGQCLLRARP